MSISEQDRYELHEALRGVIGPKQAADLMASIPPTGWADVATKHDLQELEGRLATRMAASEDRLRTEMADLRTEVRTEMAELRTEVADRLRAQMQTMVVSCAGLAAVVVAAVRL